MTLRTVTSKQSCIRPAHNELLMVNLPGELEQHVTISSPDGLSIQAFYVHALTECVLRSVQLNFHADVKLHLIASEWPDWYYILQYSSYFQRYGCSCKDGKAYQQTGKPCDHMKIVSR